MGLDMYLVKAKRVLPECSKNEVLLMELANHWISYIENEEDCTFEEYCGASNDILEEVGGLDAVKNAAELVKPNLVTLGEFIIETKKGKKLVPFRTIWNDIGYWRKANHIHKWFVDCVQDGEDDCEKYEVTKSNLLDLKAVCEEVLSLKGKDEEGLKKFFQQQADFSLVAQNMMSITSQTLKKLFELSITFWKQLTLKKELVVYQSSW